MGLPMVFMLLKEKGGDDYMIIPYSEREVAQDSYGTVYVSLYNTTKRAYEYTEKLLTTSAVGIQPGENGEKGKIFASSHRRMYCFEAAR